jgi:Flp pilus assembly protein TadD
MRQGWLLALLAVASCGVEHQRARAKAALDELDLPRAERLYRDLLTRAPDDPVALYGLGWTYHLAGQEEQARATFERCLRVAPDAPDCVKGLGSVALATGNLEVARQRFERALQQAPGDRSIRNSLALLHLRAGRLDEALRQYEQLCQEDPAEPTWAIGRAEALLRSERTEDALAEVDRALALPETGSRAEILARTLRARILLAATAGRVDEARCDQTAPQVLAWLDEAEEDVGRARELDLGYSPPVGVLRQIHDRRRAARRLCPGLPAGDE